MHPSQVLVGATAATASDQLPTAIRCPATGGRLQQHRWQQQRQQRSSFSSQASEQEAHSSSSSSSSSAVLKGSLPSSSAPPSTSCHTVVKHPPAPRWEFPPVPAGCEPTFAVIRLGNTQHKVRRVCVKKEGIRRRCCCALTHTWCFFFFRRVLCIGAFGREATWYSSTEPLDKAAKICIAECIGNREQRRPFFPLSRNSVAHLNRHFSTEEGWFSCSMTFSQHRNQLVTRTALSGHPAGGGHHSPCAE